MLPRIALYFVPIPGHNPLGPPGGGSGGSGTGSGQSGSSGGGGGTSGSSSSAASSVLALHNVTKPLGHIIQLGQPARAELVNSQRNAAVNSAKAKAHGVRKPSPRGTGSDNTPIAFFGGGALEGRGGPSAGG